MSDSHLTFQQGLVGIVLAGAAVAGHWVVEPTQTVAFLTALDSAKWAAAATLLVSPLIGLTVQAIALAFLYFRSHPYPGDARELVAGRVKEAISLSATASRETKEVITGAPSDALFVWYYYTQAPGQLIEWARRRRDGQHLGENLITASLLGIALGIATGLMGLAKISPPIGHAWLVFLLLAGVVVWVFALLFLRRKMRNDAEAMELLWAYAALDEGFAGRVRFPVTPAGSAPERGKGEA